MIRIRLSRGLDSYYVDFYYGLNIIHSFHCANRYDAVKKLNASRVVLISRGFKVA